MLFLRYFECKIERTSSIFYFLWKKMYVLWNHSYKQLEIIYLSSLDSIDSQNLQFFFNGKVPIKRGHFKLWLIRYNCCCYKLKPQKTVLKYGIKRRVDDVTKSCHKSYTYILALPKLSLAGGTSLRRRRQRRTVVGDRT